MDEWFLDLMAVPAADRVGSQTARHMAERCEAASEVQASQSVKSTGQSVLQAGEAALHSTDKPIAESASAVAG